MKKTVHIALVLKRFFRRIKYVFQLRAMLTWEFESCENCGHCFKLLWSVPDSLWNDVQGGYDGCLCVDCFVEKANDKGINVITEDFDLLKIFNP